MDKVASLQYPHRLNIGQPVTRREAVLKVTGRARYAADHHPDGMLHAVIAASSIARGRVKHLNVAAASAHPGVIGVMTPANAPQLARHRVRKIKPFSFTSD